MNKTLSKTSLSAPRALAQQLQSSRGQHTVNAFKMTIGVWKGDCQYKRDTETTAYLLALKLVCFEAPCNLK